MDHQRSFWDLARRSIGNGKPLTPTTATTSAAPTTVPAPGAHATAPASIVSTTAPALAAPTTATASAMPTITPSAAPTTAPPSAPRTTSTTTTAKGYASLLAAKGKGHEGDHRKRLSGRDDVIDVDREPKRAWTESASPLRLFWGHDALGTEAEVQKDKKQVDDKKRRTRNQRNAVDVLRIKRDKARDQKDKKNKELETKAREITTLKVEMVANLDLVKLLLGLVEGHDPPTLEEELAFLTVAAAEHGGAEECFGKLMKSLDESLYVLDPKAKEPAAVIQERTLEEYAASVGVADISGSHLAGGPDGAISHKDTVVSLDGKFSLVSGAGVEVAKSRIEDIAEGARTVEVAEGTRIDEVSKGPRIDAIVREPRPDNIFEEMEAEEAGIEEALAPVAEISAARVDEKTVP
ncbi:hypothetical protein AALP_AA2G082200 [Arabis alpina]|uniref:Uncharacterized protein n=1 Tax=Arabis alpina TaxID=50452 RepID=A0A087HG23_ARAAL|nr:hypothetical protein AALP_AA2G082200 [Arabis alpina]